jgi:hypothetical protein
MREPPGGADVAKAVFGAATDPPVAGNWDGK